MTIQYNVPIKVLKDGSEDSIETALRPYGVFADRYGNFMENTTFSREELPYVGEMLVIKTPREQAAKTIHRVLKGIEGLVVLPVTTCDLEEDIIKESELREHAGIISTPSRRPHHLRLEKPY